MKLLIATPAYNGDVKAKYLVSLLATIGTLSKNRIHTGVFTVDSDSLINRARNKCVKFALENHFDSIMFIDADIEWNPQDVLKLINHNKPIVTGTYPIKSLPLKINFNALPEHAQDWSTDRTLKSFQEFTKKYANPEGLIEVRHAPTGFMLINTNVFTALSAQKYKAYDAGTGEVSEFKDYFPIRIINGMYETEDWGFCSLVKEHGFKIFLDTSIICDHIGTYKFSTKE